MFKPLLCAFAFLTRLPVPSVSFTEREVGQSAAYFSWVGAVIALLLWFASFGLAPLDPRTSAALLIALWAILTGALHLDGLADTVDGLSGGRGNRERALEIMRDSRIGAHGAVALFVLLILKWSALESAIARGDESWAMAPIVARFGCTVLLACFPYARAEGLGSAFAGRVGFVQVMTGALALAAIAFAPLLAAWSVLIGFATTLAVGAFARRSLGGLTGDVHGAAIELSELAVLLGLGLPA